MVLGPLDLDPLDAPPSCRDVEGRVASGPRPPELDLPGMVTDISDWEGGHPEGLGGPPPVPRPGSPSRCWPRTPRPPEEIEGSPLSRSHIDRWSDRDETLIIFDWDDTLCPTSHVQRCPPQGEEHGCDEALQEHQRAVEELLRLAVGLGQVSIVTMASSSWVEESILRVMPGLQTCLVELGIQVVSAREGVGRKRLREAFGDCREPTHYLKRRAMSRVIRDFYETSRRTLKQAIWDMQVSHTGCSTRKARSWKNIVSIGDSAAERLALQDLVFKRCQRDRHGRWKECRCKTLKLIAEPDLGQLTAQLRRVAQLLPALVRHDGDADLDVADECDSQEAPAELVFDVDGALA